jgi:hypothetical protein
VANTEILKRYALRLQTLTGSDQHPCGARRGHAHAALVRIDAGHALTELRDQRRRALEVTRAGEASLEQITAELILELAGRALRNHPARVHHDNSVCEVLGLLHVLSRQQHGRAVGDEILDEAPHAVASAWIETRRRLVQEQHARTADQACPDIEPPAHPAGVGLHERVRGVGEREALEHVLGATAALDLAQLVEEPHELEVLPAREQLIDRGELPRQTDPRTQARCVGNHVAAGHPRASAVRAQQRDEDAHEGCLAGAVWAQQSQHLALIHEQVEVSECLRGPEPLAHRLDFDHRHRCPPSGRSARVPRTRTPGRGPGVIRPRCRWR